MRRLGRYLLALGLAAMTVTACGGGNTEATAASPAAATAAAGTEAAEKEEPAAGTESAAGNTEDAKRLVLYTSTSEENLNIIIPEFEKATGIGVELIRGSSGEIYARIQAEAANPYGDVAWIPESYILSDTSYFEQYVSSSNDQYEEAYQNASGYATNINYAIPVIIYNKELVDFEIRGYEDLLNPALKGKIAMGNASSSSSAYNQLENILLAMGEGDTPDDRIASDKAWSYVEEFLKQLDGIIVDSSSATYKGVLSGEYAVGMSWDTPAQEYLADRMDHIGVVYMAEGVVPKQSSLAMIKNAKNQESARAFIEYLSGREGQELLGQKVLGANPLMGGIGIADYKVDITTIPTIAITTAWSAEKKPEILAEYEELYLDILE